MVKNVKWIVAEDANTPTFQVLELLKRIQNRLPNVYLLAPMPEVYRKTKDPHHLPKVHNQKANVKNYLGLFRILGCIEPEQSTRMDT